MGSTNRKWSFSSFDCGKKVAKTWKESPWQRNFNQSPHVINPPKQILSIWLCESFNITHPRVNLSAIFRLIPVPGIEGHFPVVVGWLHGKNWNVEHPVMVLDSLIYGDDWWQFDLDKPRENIEKDLQHKVKLQSATAQKQPSPFQHTKWTKSFFQECLSASGPSVNCFVKRRWRLSRPNITQKIKESITAFETITSPI